MNFRRWGHEKSNADTIRHPLHSGPLRRFGNALSVEPLEKRCLLSAGSLDPTFGAGGLVLTEFPGVEEAFTVAVDGDGKILAAGRSAIVRYNEDGSLDPAFGNAGRVLLPSGVSVYEVAVQGDRKILVTEFQGLAADHDFGVARFNDDGSLDGSFGIDGRVTIDFGSEDELVGAVEVQADGKILVSGYSWQGATGYDFAVARLNTDGSLDDSFGNAGRVTIDFDSPEDLAYAFATAVQADGKIILAGLSWQGATGYDFAAARLNADGSLDGSFSGDGRVTVDLDSLYDYGYVVSMQADGKIILAGQSFQATTGDDFAVVRLNGDGTLDDSFSGDGRVTIDFQLNESSVADYGYSVAVQPDGKIVVGGTTNSSSFGVARLNSDGTLDESFGADGTQAIHFAIGSLWGWALALQADGNIVMAGAFQYANNWQAHFALVRLLGGQDNDGVPDAVEDGAPNNGDGNNDGIPDSQQVHVTSLPNAVDGKYVTLQSPHGTTLSTVQAVGNSPPDLPAGAETPVGTFSFTVLGATVGGTAEVVLYMPTGVVVNQYWKHDAVNGWYDFQWNGTTGARFEDRNLDGTADVVLTIADGGPGDDDGLANGRIDDPGAPVFIPSVLQVQIDILQENANLANQGVISVLLFGGSEFDVTHVDAASIRMANAAAVQWSREDVNGDGNLDLVLHFRTQETNLRQLYQQLLIDDHDGDGILDSSRQTASVALTGRALDGALFEGTDDLNVFLSGRALRDLLEALTADGFI